MSDDNKNLLVIMWPFWVSGIYLLVKFIIWISPIL